MKSLLRVSLYYYHFILLLVFLVIEVVFITLVNIRSNILPWNSSALAGLSTKYKISLLVIKQDDGNLLSWSQLIFNVSNLKLETTMEILIWSDEDLKYAGLPTKDKTSETTVQNFYCPFPYIHDLLQLLTTVFLCFKTVFEAEHLHLGSLYL